MAEGIEVLEAAEKAGEKAKTVDIEKFDPQDAENFLVGWEIKELTHRDDGGRIVSDGWDFRKRYEGEEYLLTTNQREKKVFLDSLHGPTVSIRLEGVSSVRYSKIGQVMTFYHSNGAYTIAQDGKFHYIQSKDRKAITRISLR